MTTKTARFFKAHSHAAALPKEGADMLESILFHRGCFSYAFYCGLAAYLEWTGALLTCSSQFHLQAHPDKYPRIVRPPCYNMRLELYRAVVSQDGKNGAFDGVTHLTTTWGSAPPLVRPTKVTRPCFPSVTRLASGIGMLHSIVWAHFPNLHTLDLSSNQCRSIDFLGVKHCSSLTDVNFSFSNVCLANFVSCTRRNTLKTVNLSGCTSCDHEIHCLLGMHGESIVSLDISHCKFVSPEGLFCAFKQVPSDSAVMQNLSMMYMNQDAFTDEAWCAVVSVIVKRFSTLKSLVMDGNGGAGERCCRALAKSSLETLSFGNSENMCKYQEHFFNSPMAKTLKNLSAEGNLTKLKTEGIVSFLGIHRWTMHRQITSVGCRSLVRVNFSDCNLLKAGAVCALARLNRNLRVVFLNQCISCHGSVLEALGEYCPELVRLEAERMQIIDTSVQAMARGCPKLEIFRWTSPMTTNAALVSLGRHCANLRSVKAINYSRGEPNLLTYQYSDAGMMALAQGCRKLEKVYMPTLLKNGRLWKVNKEVGGFTDATLKALRGLPLVKVSLIGNHGFTNDAVQDFLDKTPTVNLFESTEGMSCFDTEDEDEYVKRARGYCKLMKA